MPARMPALLIRGRSQEAPVPSPDCKPLTHGYVSDQGPGVPTNLKLDDKLIAATLKLGHFKTKQEAVNTALAEFVQRRQRRSILELAGQIDFDPEWDYKAMRRRRS